jgi:hypothetical protein
MYDLSSNELTTELLLGNYAMLMPSHKLSISLAIATPALAQRIGDSVLSRDPRVEFRPL